MLCLTVGEILGLNVSCEPHSAVQPVILYCLFSISNNVLESKVHGIVIARVVGPNSQNGVSVDYPVAAGI